MHFQLFAVSISLIFVECSAQYGDGGSRAGGYLYTPSPSRYYRTQPLQYRAIIREQPLQPPLSYSSPYREQYHGHVVFDDSPVLETASPEETSSFQTNASPDSDDFPANEQFTTTQPHPVQEDATVAEESEANEENGAEENVVNEEAPAEETTVNERVVEESTTTEETNVNERVPEESTTTEETHAEETTSHQTVAEETTTAGAVHIENLAIETVAVPVVEVSETVSNHSNAEDDVIKDGKVAEMIDAANILFFNRSEISALCFQTSQNNARNNRLQLVENAQVVAQCLEDMPPQPLICNPVDMVFVLDGSGSIGTENFVVMKNWVRQFVNTYLDTGSAEKQSQVGVIEFSDSAFVHVPLGGYSKEKILTDIGTTPYDDGGTQIGLALNLACQEFSSDLSDRSYAKNVMILLTDGQSDDQSSIINGVTCAQSKNIDIVAIGIGKGFNESQLAFITDHKANRLFSIANFNGLDESLAEDLCTKINDNEMTKGNENCLYPTNGTPDCSNSVIFENGCSYLVNKCRLGCNNNSSGYETRQIEAGYGRR